MTQKLRDFLSSQIQTSGPMDVGSFMACVLGHPEHGYYMRQDPFGVAGDFTTAPEISQMFGEVIGAWVADVWMQLGSPGSFVLLECGPGRGTLMADMLRVTKKVAGFHEAAQIHFLETSPVLKKAQAEALKEAKPQWHDSLDNVPPDMPLIVIANEFLDALPIRQLQRTKDGYGERVIGLDYPNFTFGLKPFPGTIPEDLGAVPEGGVFEFSPARESFVQAISSRLKNQRGAALFIDYGEMDTKPGDSLRAIYKHKHISPLDNVGEADLSANVDFAALKEEAEEMGVSVSGPVEQGAFLESLGIEVRAQKLQSVAADEKQRDDIEKSLRRLTESDQMGALFKVMGLSYENSLSLAGF